MKNARKDAVLLVAITIMGGAVGLISGGYAGLLLGGYLAAVTMIVFGFVGMMVGAMLSVCGGGACWRIAKQQAATSPNSKNRAMLLCIIPLAIGICIFLSFHVVRSMAADRAQQQPRSAFASTGPPKHAIRFAYDDLYYIIPLDTLWFVAVAGFCAAAGARSGQPASRHSLK